MKAGSVLLASVLGAGVLLLVPERLSAQGTGSIDEQRKLADQLYDAGKRGEAEAIYLRLTSSFTKDFEFNRRLADCLFVSPKKEMAQAARYYAIANHLNPKDPDVEMNLGKAYSWSSQYKAAITVFRHIVAREPLNGEAKLQLARAESLGGETHAARATYDSYLGRWPGDREVRLEFAAFLGRNKQPEAALGQYRYILKVDSRNLKARLGEAQLLVWQGNLKEGLRNYEAILGDVPDNEDALRGKAFVLLKLQRYEEAGEIFARMNKKKPGDKDVQDALQQIARWKALEPEHQAQAQLEALIQAASASAANGDYPHAIELLLQAIARKPQEDLRFRLGQYYLWSGQSAQAVEVFQKLYAERPENLEALRELGQAQAEAGQSNDAISTYRAYLQRSPEPAVQVSLANVLRWSGNYEEAASIYRQVLGRDPNDVDALRGLAYALAGLRQYQQALELVDTILQRQPGNRDAQLEKAEILHWEGEQDKSLEILETMQKTWPQDRQIASALQSVLDSERERAVQAQAPPGPVDLEARIQKYQETLAQDPKNPVVLERLGELYREKKDYPRAIAYFEKALEQQPSNTTLRLEMARVAGWNGDYPRSIALYQELLAQDPGNRDYRLQLAKIMSWAGRKAESIEQYRLFLKQNPNDREARQELAKVLSWNGDYPGAIQVYKDLLAQDPNNRDYHLQVARMLSWAGRKDESVEEYRQILKLYPNDQDSQLGLAKVLSWKSDYTASNAIYQSLIKQDPKNREYRYGMAQGLYWSGRARDAKPILEELLAQDPKDRDVAISLASVLNSLGRQDLALRQLDELDKLAPGNRDVEQMRGTIREDLAPVLSLRFEPLQDNDGLRIYQSSATLYFSIVPRVRSYVSTASATSEEPGLDWENGLKTVFGSYGRVNNWLLLRGEAGVNTSTAGHTDPIGSAGATLSAGNKLQFDFDVSRSFLNYITQPLLLNISRLELAVGADWRPDRRTTFHLDYYNQRYSDTNRNNGGTFRFTRTLLRRERFDLDAGYRFHTFGFSKDIASGFWAPVFYQEHMGVANLKIKLTSRMGLSFRSLFGPEQSHGQGGVLEPFRRGMTQQGSWDYSVSKHLKFTLGYAYSNSFSLHLVNGVSNGYYAHLGWGTLDYRF